MDGGPLEHDGILTLSPGGGFSILGYSGNWVDIESLDQFSDDYMNARSQPDEQLRRSLD